MSRYNVSLLAAVIFEGILLAWPLSATGAADPFATKKAITPGPFPTVNEADVCSKDRIKNPLTLADVVELALCNSPQVRLQWASSRALAAQVGVSKSSYFPSLTGSLTVSGSRTDAAGTSSSTNQKNIGITASYLLYDFGGRAASVENAKQLLVAANATRDDVLRNIFIAAVQNYYTLLLARASVQAYQVAEEAAEKSLGAAQARYRAGSGTPADGLQAQTALSQAKLNRIRAEGDAANAQGALANIMGFDATQPFELVTPTPESGPDAVAEQDALVEQNIGELIAAARQSRPDLLAAEAQIKAAEAQLAVTKAAGMPSLSLSGSLSQAQSTETTSSSRSQSLNVTLSVPWFTGFKNTYQTGAGRAQLEGKVAERDRVANQIALEVWKAYQALLTNSQALRAADDLQIAAEQSEKMILGRYQAGLGSILDVLTAQSTLASALQQRISALYNFKVSKFVLAQSIGQLDLAMVETKN